MKRFTLALTLVALATSVPVAARPGDLYIYPAKGQPAEQIERDRYDCYVWASRESGFDPAKDEANPPPDLVKVPIGRNEKKGATFAGTVIGAIAGAAIGNGHHSGDSAAAGAAIGTMIGASVEQEGQRKVEAEAQQQAEQIALSRKESAQLNDDYRRAFSACLEGRGYVVR